MAEWLVEIVEKGRKSAIIILTIILRNNNNLSGGIWIWDEANK